jgi:metallophosphoesterase (TIGR00282 family)
MNVLFIGDIVGNLGRKIVTTLLPRIKKEEDIDFVIANGENVTHGRGLNKRHFLQLREAGVDVVTLGNHFKDRPEIADYIDDYPELLRPVNLLEVYPGEGTNVFKLKNGIKVRVTNVLGQAFIKTNVTSPYAAIMDIFINEREKVLHIIDFHAEATAEKQAIGHFFDGKVSAVLGTHTHVQTSDARVLPGGTAYISDVGFCGDDQGILGVEQNSVIEKMWFDNSAHYTYRSSGETAFNAVKITFDEETYKALEIKPIYITLNIDE